MLYKRLSETPPVWLQVNRHFRRRLLQACLYVVSLDDGCEAQDPFELHIFTHFLTATANLHPDVSSRSFIQFLRYGDIPLDAVSLWRNVEPADQSAHPWLSAKRSCTPIDWGAIQAGTHPWLSAKNKHMAFDWALEDERAQAIQFLRALPFYLPSLMWRSPLPIDEKIGRILEARRIEDVFLSSRNYFAGESPLI